MNEDFFFFAKDIDKDSIVLLLKCYIDPIVWK